jgi:hypothetical protein
MIFGFENWPNMDCVFCRQVLSREPSRWIDENVAKMFHVAHKYRGRTITDVHNILSYHIINVTYLNCGLVHKGGGWGAAVTFVPQRMNDEN